MGSSVTATKGNITLSPSIWNRNANNTQDCAIFTIPSSTFDNTAWTVTFTLGERIGSNTIIVNSAKKYNMELYDILLYSNGVIGSATGGFIAANIGSGVGSQSSSNSNGVLIFTNTYSSGSNQKTGLFYTNTAINLTKFSSLKTTVASVTGSFSENDYPQVGVLTTLTASWRPTIVWLAHSDITSAISTSTTITTDISSITDDAYIAFGVGNGSSVKTTTIQITDWHLEI